ncbi:hypothetical protein HYX00_00625 [Candidatus Woesearchaeota archaeon]|nr:hypothetical protein [Candidatus Woesearchaeota archaeon]
MLTPQQKLQILQRCFFFNEFVQGTRTKASFLEELQRFSSNLKTDGFSDEEIEEIKNRVKRLIIVEGVSLEIERIIPGSQKPRIRVIKPLRVRVLDNQEARDFLHEPWALDPQSFVNQVRNFIYTSMNSRVVLPRQPFLQNPSSAYLSNHELEFLCAALHLENVAFLIDRNMSHCLFITKVTPPLKEDF